MLKPTASSDRINYGNLILPELGYHLVKAIGTTYSLDFDTLVAVAMKLGLIQDADEELQDDLTGVLAAFSKVSDRMLVFCEAGQIQKIKNAKPIFLLMEKIVVPITLSKKNEQGKYASFHSKFWLLQYANQKGEFKYKLVVLSRNLTIDHSWDVAISLDSSSKCEKDNNTEKIQCFLEFLSEQLTKESTHYKRQKELISLLVSDLNSVSFEVGDDAFTDFDFLPSGIGKHSCDISKAFFGSKVSEMLVISPFISKTIIRKLSDNCETNNMSLITRKTELSKIASGNGYDFKVYIVRDDVIEGEGYLSEFDKNVTEEPDTEDNRSDEEHDYLRQDIHAKVYLFNDNNSSRLYLGSLNASHNALKYNVETLICLHSSPDKLNYSKLHSEVIGNLNDKNCPFELAEFEYKYPEDDDKSDDLQQIVKDICRLQRKAVVICQDDGLYTVKITCEEYNSNYNIQISPFLCKVSRDFGTSIVFSDMEIFNLSEFYTINVSLDDKHIEKTTVS